MAQGLREKLPLEMITPQCDQFHHEQCPGKSTDGYYILTVNSGFDERLIKLTVLEFGDSRLYCTCSCHKESS